MRRARHQLDIHGILLDEVLPTGLSAAAVLLPSAEVPSMASPRIADVRGIGELTGGSPGLCCGGVVVVGYVGREPGFIADQLQKAIASGHATYRYRDRPDYSDAMQVVILCALVTGIRVEHLEADLDILIDDTAIYGCCLPYSRSSSWSTRTRTTREAFARAATES